MSDTRRKLAVVTGASTGIGLELARECAKNNFDLIIAANEAEIESAAEELRRDGGTVEVVHADLATIQGVSTARSMAARLQLSSPTPAAASARDFLTRISTKPVPSLIPTSPARSTSFTRSAVGCAHRAKAASLLPVRLLASCRAPIRPSTTALKHFSTRFPTHSGKSSRTRASR